MRPGIEASAPTRIDLAGGTLDLWPIGLLVPGACTINLAISLRARARVEPLPGEVLEIVSEDRGHRTRRRLPLRSDPAGPLSWLLRLAAAHESPSGYRLITRAEAPAGAGLGGSSALGIAVAAALDRFAGVQRGAEARLRRVMNLETRELRVPTGDQDYRAATYGGLAVYHQSPDGVRREPLEQEAALGEHLVLAYTGQSRLSGNSNWDMYRRFIEGDPQTTAAMRAIARVARDMADALRRGRWREAGRLLGEEGRLRARLAPSVSTAAVRRVEDAAYGAGAWGVKVCGAGGGGCVVAMAPRRRRDRVAGAITATGSRVLLWKPSRRGVRVRRLP